MESFKINISLASKFEKRKKERKVGQHVSPACLSDSIKSVCQMTNHACNPTKSMFAFCCTFCQGKGRIPLSFNSEIQVNVSKVRQFPHTYLPNLFISTTSNWLWMHATEK